MNFAIKHRVSSITQQERCSGLISLGIVHKAPPPGDVLRAALLWDFLIPPFKFLLRELLYCPELWAMLLLTDWLQIALQLSRSAWRSGCGWVNAKYPGPCWKPDLGPWTGDATGFGSLREKYPKLRS